MLRVTLDPNAFPLDGRWRNAKCDVLVAWSHVHHGGHLLVTQDGDFLRRAEKLAHLDAGRVLGPMETIGVLGSVSRRLDLALAYRLVAAAASRRRRCPLGAVGTSRCHSQTDGGPIRGIFV